MLIDYVLPLIMIPNCDSPFEDYTKQDEGRDAGVLSVSEQFGHEVTEFLGDDGIVELRDNGATAIVIVRTFCWRLLRKGCWIGGFDGLECCKIGRRNETTGPGRHEWFRFWSNGRNIGVTVFIRDSGL